MYRAIVLLVTFITILAFSKDHLEKCGRFSAPDGMSCCKKKYKIFPESADKADCLKLSRKPPAFDAQICLAKKGGFGFDDGTIDKAVLEKLLNKLLADEKALLDAIQENCFVNDFKKYGPPEFCDLIKMKGCIDITMIKDCPEWESEGACSGAEEASKECLAVFT